MTRKKKPKRGRPVGTTKPDSRRRVLSTRVSETELGVCLGAAQEARETLGDWLRRVAVEQAMGAFRSAP